MTNNGSVKLSDIKDTIEYNGIKINVVYQVSNAGLIPRYYRKWQMTIKKPLVVNMDFHLDEVAQFKFREIYPIIIDGTYFTPLKAIFQGNKANIEMLKLPNEALYDGWRQISETKFRTFDFKDFDMTVKEFIEINDDLTQTDSNIHISQINLVVFIDGIRNRDQLKYDFFYMDKKTIYSLNPTNRSVAIPKAIQQQIDRIKEARKNGATDAEILQMFGGDK